MRSASVIVPASGRNGTPDLVALGARGCGVEASVAEYGVPVAEELLA